MRKTLVYIAILAILAFSIYYFLFNTQGNQFGDSEAGFTVRDTAAIGRLYLVANDGEGVLVERTDSGWMVNKQYRALPSTLNLLLQTLHDQAPLYPVTKNAYDNVVKNLSSDAVKIEVYGRDGKKMRVFYVGGPALNNTGTNMMMEGAHTPYVVQVTGFNGYLTPRYPHQLKDWRDRNIFNIPAEEIKSVSLKYAGKPVNSFVINRENGSYTVTGDTDITKHLSELNKRRVDVYMKYFTGINCEGYLNGLSDMDTTIKTAPLQSTIDIEGMHGQHQHVDIYWMAINRRSKNLVTSNPDVPDDYDVDRLYAVINNYKDTVMIQRFVFKKIFRKSYEFFMKDEDGPPVPKNPGLPRNVMMHKNI